MLPVWHLCFALLAVITAALVAIEGEVGAGRRVAVLGVLAVWTGWYAAVGVPALKRESERHGLVYLAAAGPMAVALFALRPVGAVMLFVFYPHIWMLLSFRRAIAGTVATIVAVGVVMLARSGVHARVLFDALVLAGVCLLVALILGTWIAKVIEQSQTRARLVAELSATREDLARVSGEAGVLAERERLAQEIHDTLAQGFTSILILLDALESELSPDQEGARRHLGLARHSAADNLAEARALIAAATPVHLEEASFPEAMGRLVEHAGRDRGVSARHTVSGQPRPLPVEHEVALLRVLQEALTNVHKHADAGLVEACLRYDDDGVVLEVRDDGRGFDEATGSDAGFGLSGMRRRVRGTGGSFHVGSSPGVGTVVHAELPRTVTD